MKYDKVHFVAKPKSRPMKKHSREKIYLTTDNPSACGRDAYVFTNRWGAVDCKLCLKKKPRQSPDEGSEVK